MTEAQFYRGQSVRLKTGSPKLLVNGVMKYDQNTSESYWTYEVVWFIDGLSHRAYFCEEALELN